MGQAGELLRGRYRLEALLGRGGMGEVWHAFDLRLERGVAVKFLPRGLAGGDAVARFHREARITAGLQHPGIVQVFDHDEHGDQLYLVMELLPGEDLGRLTRRHPGGMPVHQALGLAAQVADALSHAHRAGIVHRDVKPANIMLLPGNWVKVCDFGLAGFARSASGLTQEGAILGTPAFMAPEQCRGRHVDGRADLYALGCVLFTLLTGRPPFTGQGDFISIALEHLGTEPPGVREFRPDLPLELDRLIAGLLAKDPADRPGPAGVVADRLRALADARPAAQPPPPAAPTADPERPRFAPTGFTIEVEHDAYRSQGDTKADAVVTLASAGAAPHDLAAAAPRALVLLLTLSTALPEAEFRAVTGAVADAVDALDDEVRFALVAGSEYAQMLYPETMRLVRATPETRAEARAALARLRPVDAAAYGRGIRLADRLLSGHPDAVRTAIQLMDVTNTAESDAELKAALAACTGRLTCHVRGIGLNWEIGPARVVATALGGTLDLVRKAVLPSGEPALARELGSIIARTRQSTARDLALRVTTPHGGGVHSLMRVEPGIENLTGAGHPVASGAREYRVDVPDGESCVFHLELDLPARGPGERFTAAWLELVHLPPTGDGRTLARATVDITDDTVPAARPIDQAELLRAIQAGLDELRRDHP